MRPNKRQNHVAPREIPATSQNFHAAFTVTELLAVVALVAILFVIILPRPLHRKSSKAYALRIRCINNLKNVGLAYRIYASNNNERLPWEIPSPKDEIHINYLSDPSDYLRRLTNELSTPTVVNCPADARPALTNWTGFARTNMSYFISPDASAEFPNSFLAGDRNITNKNGRLPPGLHAPSPIDTVGWDKTIHKNQGNACMGDGSVQQLSSLRLREQLRNTGLPNNHIKLSLP